MVKLCGNFLIASSIEAIAEAMALAEKNDVDRKLVMELLSTTIFDCLIYKGYGQRVSDRDHRPGISLCVEFSTCMKIHVCHRRILARARVEGRVARQ